MLAIQEALATIGFAAFCEKFWDNEVVAVPRTKSASQDLEDLLEAISSFLDRTDIRLPDVRLVQEGREFPLESYTRELRVGSYVSHDWVDKERMFQAYKEGATIVLQVLRHNLPSFGTSINSLERLFGCTVNASCFITPSGSQGFSPHYDTYSSFAVQLVGEKRWKFYGNAPLLPIGEDQVEEDWESVQPTEEIILRPGDVLYVPRRHYHSACATEAASVHMSIALLSADWIHIMRASLANLTLDPRLRVSPPSMRLPSRGDESTLEIERIVCSQLDLSAGLKSISDDVFFHHVDTRSGRLLDLLELSRNDVIESYQLQPVPYRLTLQDEHALLQFANKELRFPDHVYPVLTAICSFNSSFGVNSLPETHDEDSMLLLLRTLTEEGFLRIARTRA
jgi:lysine-specific demethylase/histidyl-hydroxylase NO66